MAGVPAILAPRTLLAVRTLLHLAGLAPLAWIVISLFTGGLGANPAEAMIRELGVWGLRILLLTLAITPLRTLTGATWLIRVRRLVGLYSFAYVALHFTAYLLFQQGLDFGRVAEDIVKRPYILVGVSALLLLLPLAVTSTNGWMRRLGKRWKRLHRLVYPAAILGVFHFFMLIKANAWSEPLLYAGILTALLGFRLVRTGAARLRPGPARRRATRGGVQPSP